MMGWLLSVSGFEGVTPRNTFPIYCNRVFDCKVQFHVNIHTPLKGWKTHFHATELETGDQETTSQEALPIQTQDIVDLQRSF